MQDMLVLALIVACVLLWRRTEALSERLAVLEHAPPHLDAREVPAAWVEPAPEPVVAPVPPRAAPSPWSRSPEVQAPPVAPVPPVPIPVVEELVEDAPHRPGAPQPRFDLEELFGRRLPIWAGGITLAVAGFLVVKYSIEAGLLSPLIRVLTGLAFGVALIGGAEAARRRADAVADPRVAQALGGAGVATLYGCVLAAANLYGLIGAGVAFAGMAAVTALAGGLALRFGAPSALLGLVGGLSAPALVGAGEPNVPLLAAYLSLAVGGLCTLARSRGWVWLGGAALIGGFGWGAVLIWGGPLDASAALSVGVFTLLIGIALPLVLIGGRARLVQLAAGLAGCAQMAALVATGGFSALTWGSFALIAAAAVWLARREPALRPLAPAALAVTLFLLFAWPQPTAAMLAAVLAGAVAIHGGPAARDLWRVRGTAIEATRVAALAMAIPAAALIHLDPPAWIVALLAGGGAVVTGALAAIGWRVADRGEDARFATLAAVAGVLATVAGVALAPDWLDAGCATLAAAGLLLLSLRAGDPRIERVAWAVAGAAMVWLIGEGLAGADVERALGSGDPLSATRAIAWGVPAAMAVLFAVRARQAGEAAQVAAILLGYVAAAQLVPAQALPIVPALVLAALPWRWGATPARAAAAALAAGWAAMPVLIWFGMSTAAVLGDPLLATAFNHPAESILRIALPAVALIVAARGGDPLRAKVLPVAAMLALIAVHMSYKQLFHLSSAADFVARGMAERTGWELLLTAAAVAVRRRSRTAARVLGGLALAYAAWFTGVLHNPLWAEQAVGAWPLANLLLPAYAAALLLLHAARHEPLPAAVLRAREWAVMATVLLFAASTVRQVAHGAILTAGATGQGEDIAYSLLAIGAAGAFLVQGIRARVRDWRVASLLLMLVAVVKVFLHDAAGLDGIARIVSFAGLGFSLIGVGWLYSRFLPEAKA